jgi:hypothetical protein
MPRKICLETNPPKNYQLLFIEHLKKAFKPYGKVIIYTRPINPTHEETLAEYAIEIQNKNQYHYFRLTLKS